MVAAGRLSVDASAILLDMRDAAEYSAGHIEGTASADFASMQQKQNVMSKLPKNRRIILIDKDGQTSSRDAAILQSRGYDADYLEGGMNAWKGPLVQSGQNAVISGTKLHGMIQDQGVFMLDVREPSEFEQHHIPGAVNVPLGRILSNDIPDVPNNKKVITICSHGNRSMVASFALAGAGIKSSSLTGGMVGWGQVSEARSVPGTDIIQVEKVGKGCLSYVVFSNNEAAVIDPTYPPRRYMEIAAERGATIKTVMDTHQHADHVSAAADLATLCGATLYLSSREQYQNIPHRPLNGGDSISVGDTHLAIIHTPGHTDGSMSVSVNGTLMVGDTIFADAVGRPDLRDRAAESASTLYDTIQNILRMAPDTLLLPAHRGEKTMPREGGIFGVTVSEASAMTITAIPKEQFVDTILGSIPPKPANHSRIIMINSGRISIPPQMIPDLEAGPNRCSIQA